MPARLTACRLLQLAEFKNLRAKLKEQGIDMYVSEYESMDGGESFEREILLSYISTEPIH